MNQISVKLTKECFCLKKRIQFILPTLITKSALHFVSSRPVHANTISTSVETSMLHKSWGQTLYVSNGRPMLNVGCGQLVILIIPSLESESLYGHTIVW